MSPEFCQRAITIRPIHKNNLPFKKRKRIHQFGLQQGTENFQVVYIVEYIQN